MLAEAAGVANLKDDVAAAIAPDVEYRLREVIQVPPALHRGSPT